MSEKDRLEFSFVRSFVRKHERVNREKGTSIRNGVSRRNSREGEEKEKRGESVVSRHRYFFSRYLAWTK